MSMTYVDNKHGGGDKVWNSWEYAYVQRGLCTLQTDWQMYFVQQKFTAVQSHLKWCFTCLAILSCSYISFLYLIELYNWKQFTGTLRLLQRPYLICRKQWPIFWPQCNWCFQFHVHVIQLDICFGVCVCVCVWWPYFFENTHPGWDSWVIKSYLVRGWLWGPITSSAK